MTQLQTLSPDFLIQVIAFCLYRASCQHDETPAQFEFSPALHCAESLFLISGGQFLQRN